MINQKVINHCLFIVSVLRYVFTEAEESTPAEVVAVVTTTEDTTVEVVIEVGGDEGTTTPEPGEDISCMYLHIAHCQ